MKRAVSDSDMIRRQNRGLVLDVIRRNGPLPRTQLAQETGLSHATITAISSDMIAQSVLTDLVEKPSENKSRGRPAVRVGFNRCAGYALLIEVDVTKARFSLVNYSGTLVDRLEAPLNPHSFREMPPVDFIAERIEQMGLRNSAEAKRILRVAISVQGILDRDGLSLKWSPVPHLAAHNLVGGIEARFKLPVVLFKRGKLLAEGARWLIPAVQKANIATIFIGSTVAMGVSIRSGGAGSGENSATEFGHMNHSPNGALCRCGMRGCIEAYASDYGVLRTTYGVPDRTPPAPAVPPNEYEKLIAQAHAGDRSTLHAFNLAGSALGFGISRLMTVFDLTHILIVGPGARAFPFMRKEFDAAVRSSLIATVHDVPQTTTYDDESEPVFKGLMMKALMSLDQSDFAALPSAVSR